MGMTITKLECVKFIGVAEGALTCIGGKKRRTLRECAELLQREIKNLVNLANSYTSVWNLFRNLFGMQPMPIPYDDYIPPSLEELQDLILQSDGALSIDAIKHIPSELVAVGQSYVSNDFGKFKHPFAQYIDLKTEIIRILEVLVLADLVDQPLTLEINELLVLARARTMLGFDKDKNDII